LRSFSITLADVTVAHGAAEVFSHATLTVSAGSRIGVVGPNGVGKTTLLRLLVGLQKPDRGVVRRVPDHLSVGYLPQEVDLSSNETVRRYLERRTEASETRIAATASELRLGLERQLETLSGGEAARARLATLLLTRHDMYCLDEPTNDLDFDGLARLERFVGSVSGGVVVVSHDRAFLDRTVDRIVEVEEGRQRLREWPGGWSDYEAAREHVRGLQYRRFEEAQERRRQVEGLLTERRRQARGGESLGKRTGGADRRGTKALKAKVRQAERALERLEGVEKPFEPWRLRLELEPANRVGDLVVRLERAVIDRGSFRLGPLDLELGAGDRVALTGRNGTGKSALLGALLGTLPLAAGNRIVGPRAVLGELDQRRLAFSQDEILAQAFPSAAEMPPEAARTLLAKFGLGANDVLRPVRSLSPGERTRAALALLMARGVNCLMLDEPTNHLDLPAIEELEAALESYAGMVVLVTHDRRLLEAFHATRQIEL
jgi:ATPase subunit of ABC transporter with duplicated ATPase domains